MCNVERDVGIDRIKKRVSCGRMLSSQPYAPKFIAPKGKTDVAEEEEKMKNMQRVQQLHRTECVAHICPICIHSHVQNQW